VFALKIQRLTFDVEIEVGQPLLHYKTSVLQASKVEALSTGSDTTGSCSRRLLSNHLLAGLKREQHANAKIRDTDRDCPRDITERVIANIIQSTEVCGRVGLLIRNVENMHEVLVPRDRVIHLDFVLHRRIQEFQ
jgi:hypothetical protein